MIIKESAQLYSPIYLKLLECLPNNPLLAKLNAYSLNISSVEYIKSYLSQPKQKVKINNTFSKLTGIFYGVPQGSISGSPLFNIFLCDLFLVVPDIGTVSYADDNTPYLLGVSEEENIYEIKNTTDKLFQGSKITT